MVETGDTIDVTDQDGTTEQCTVVETFDFRGDTVAKVEGENIEGCIEL